MHSHNATNELPDLNGEHNVSLLTVLRRNNPALRISTELVRLDDALAVVRMELALPDGGGASALGSADATLPGAVELAETRALSRALIALAMNSEIKESVLNSPLPTAIVVTAAEHEAEVASRQPVSAPEPGRIERGTVGEIETSPEEAGDDPPLEDYSWTAFWLWARKLGYDNKVAVEKLIGESITSLNPAQVRNLLRAKTGAE